MKALVCHGPHDLRLTEMPEPEPGPGELLVRVEAGGVCGSDLHYYHAGGFGTVRIREPMVLGHEVAGTICAAGDGTDAGRVGERIAINPSRPCGHCGYCRKAMFNHCENMRFYGSAMPFPHIQGAFSQLVTIDPAQAAPVGDVDVHHAAMAEPFSVGLHAMRRAGGVAGKRVLITGCGPIGVLAVLAAHVGGAREIVATDLVDSALATAKSMGADVVHNATDETAMGAYAAGKGTFDVVVEASGSQPALVTALSTVRAGGTVVQLGIGGDMSVPMTMLTAKEVNVVGSFRFHEEFEWAASLIASGKVDLSPVLSDVFAIEDAIAAFDHASDRAKAMKVQIAF